MSSQILFTVEQNSLAVAGETANASAARHVFDEYRQRRASNTLRRQTADLSLFTVYLERGGVPVGDLQHKPDAWRGMSWGLVEGFKQWMLQQGYAVGSINVRLSTIKIYARLTAKAGIIDPTEYALIKAVDGYSYKEKPRLDEKREAAGLTTRVGKKKTHAVSITPAQADRLKNAQPDTPQGRRDALLMCLLLDHGLRCGEVAALDVKAIDLKCNKLTFYRAKVSIEQTHWLSTDTIQAAQIYFNQGDAPTAGSFLRGSRKDGTLTGARMSERAITKRVKVLGEKVGVENLSAHDCRHFWATDAAESGTVMSILMQAGGWASPAMPARYIKAAEIANEGIRQGARR